MLEEVWRGAGDMIGLGSEDLTVWEMALRAIIIYVAAVSLVRFGEKRFMGKNTAFDVILGIILGSVLSRAITGNAGFFHAVGAGAVLVGLHWLFSVAAFHSDRFGSLIKGSARTLVEDGEINWENMRKSHVGKNDLLGALRANGQVTGVDEVRLARFERDGDISVIPREQAKGFRVISVPVREGVQTVRIEVF